MKEATHHHHGQNANILDLIFTNEEGMINDLRLTAPLGKSHHSGILFKFTGYTEQNINSIRKPLFHKGDYEGFGQYLRSFNWITDFNDKPCNDRWQIFSERLSIAIEKFIPHTKPKKPGKPKQLWMTHEALDKIREKNRAFKRYRNTRSDDDYSMYARARNQAKWICNRAKRDFEKKIARESKTNPKGFYKYVNKNLKTKPTIADLEDNGEIITEDSKKADILNQYFSSVFTREDSSTIPTLDQLQTQHEFIRPNFTEEDILKHLKLLKPSKSPGPDEMHPYLLGKTCQDIALPLSLIMQSSYDKSVLPQDWKDANVSPIFKKGRKADRSNYRPVSLTSIICKLMETLIRDKLMEHLVCNNLLSDYQHGFIRGRSCTTQLLQCLDTWTELLDNNQPFDAIYLDFAKAFDSVPHIRLINKIKSYGIDEKTTSWIKCFLNNRRQRVVVNGTKSSWNDVISGVPQGSVIGPSLFIIYINDIPNAVKCLIQLFADDTKIFNPVSNSEEHQSLQKDLDELKLWSNKWQLNFNASKCKVMHFGHNNPNFNYRMDGSMLENVNEEKDLGVTVDTGLTFDSHINQKVNKANKILGLIRRSFSYLDREMLITLYKSLVRPHLEYCHTITYPIYDRQAKLIEGVQRRATKLINYLKDKPYDERLRELKLPSLYYRRLRGDLIETYKYTHDMYTTAHKPFTLDSNIYNTRGHNYKLSKQRCNKNTRKHFFSLRITNHWNNLPYNVVNAPSLNAFKSRLDIALSSYHYKLNPDFNRPVAQNLQARDTTENNERTSER